MPNLIDVHELCILYLCPNSDISYAHKLSIEWVIYWVYSTNLRYNLASSAIDNVASGQLNNGTWENGIWENSL